MAFAALVVVAAAQLATAHFGIEYPTWRANTLASNTSYSQWTYPCAGVPGNLTNGNRTEWPLAGGSLKLDLHHPWSYVFVNLGIGADVSNFNYTLTDPFWNETGKGTLCVPKLALPAGLPIRDGSLASIQVVTLGKEGNALYNCANIIFRANATVLGGSECTNGTGVSVVPVVAQSSTQSSSSAPSPSPSQRSGGSSMGVNVAVLSSVVALMLLFVFGTVV